MKKLLVIAGALAVAVLAAPAFMAFEAHVVNVTATIENALQVRQNSIEFGTVFPQGHLNQPLNIALSQYFLDEDRVDDVEYFIRQKPKCGITSQLGTVLDHQNTATGHVNVDPKTGVVTIDCGPTPRILGEGESWGVLPSLCEYISKEGPDANDSDTASFHEPWQVVSDNNGTPTDTTDDFYKVVWLDTLGRLAKSDLDSEDQDPRDTTDNWIIDLAVPCFGGYCAQDWATFVHGINPQADPAAYTQDILDEHKVFGCDLWVEVSEVSEAGESPTGGL